MEEAVKVWQDRLMYGRAFYLKGKTFSIRRSSGEIEPGWTFYTSPYKSCFKWDMNKNKEIVYCANDEKQLLRWCILDDVLDVNPEHVWRNLCVNCGIDMGDNNPRQLCRKTYCENQEGEFR